MRKVEKTAWGFVLRCLESEKRESLCLPVPIERWIEGPLNLRLEVADLSKFAPAGHEVLGMAIYSTRTIRVSHRIVDQENRYRFTIAHELGHLALHGHLSGSYRDSTDGAYLDAVVEREADKFAAAFLVPANAFRQELPRITAYCGFEAAQFLEQVSNEDSAATAIFLNEVVPRISRRFGVAKTTALGRFRDLQIDGTRPMVPHRILQQLHKRLDGKRGTSE